MPRERIKEYAVEIVGVPWTEYARENPEEARMKARLQAKFFDTVLLALKLHKEGDEEWLKKYVEENW